MPSPGDGMPARGRTRRIRLEIRKHARHFKGETPFCRKMPSKGEPRWRDAACPLNASAVSVSPEAFVRFPVVARGGRGGFRRQRCRSRIASMESDRSSDMSGSTRPLRMKPLAEGPPSRECGGGAPRPGGIRRPGTAREEGAGGRSLPPRACGRIGFRRSPSLSPTSATFSWPPCSCAGRPS